MLMRACHSAALILVLASAGCGFTPDIIIVQPGSPVLAQKFKGRYVRVAAYDKVNNQMIDVGWVELKDYQGWTLTPFDWEAKIKREVRSDAGTDRGSNP